MMITRTIASILFASLLFGIVLISPTNTSSQTRRETSKTSDQNLTGQKAVDELKRSGGYESLNEAFKKASGMSLGDPEPANLLPGGTYEEMGLTASDGGGGDALGFSVAVSGDTAVVGAFQDDVAPNVDQGSAYVFVRSGSTWTQQQKLTASDGSATDWFGYNVTISGDTIVVGAVYDDIASNANQGSAYVFTRTGTTWSEQQKLTASDGDADDYFGYALSLKGDTLVAGVYANLNFKGAVYVYTRSGTTWTQGQKLAATDGVSIDHFGYSVALDPDGNTMVIGAVWDNIGSNTKQGSAYVFTKSGSTWSEQQKLIAADGATEDWFGFRVGISGDTVIISSFFDDVTATNQGSAYIFTRSGTTWTQQAKLVTSDAAANDQLGAIGIWGDTAVIGSGGANIGSTTDQGAAYVFKRSGTSWSQQTKLTSSTGMPNDQLGGAIAIEGDTIVVGSHVDDVGSNVDQGSVKIFQTKMTISKVIASDGVANDQFGSSVAVSGDTAVVGVPADDIGSNDGQGSAYVFTRSGGAWVQQQKLIASDGAVSDFFAYSVAISGDTVVVGALYDNVTFSDQGSAYVFTRSGSTWTQQAKLVASDGAANDQFGSSVAVSGDTVVVGAPYDDSGAISDHGSAYVFTRSGGTWNQQSKLVASDGAVSDFFAYSVAISGDTAVVGAPWDDVGSNTDQGSAYVFTRSGGTWTQQQLVASDGAAYDYFGWSVAVSGDTAVVGAFIDRVGSNTNQGSAYVFTLSGGTWSEQQKLVASDGAAYDQFGRSVSVSGDTAVVGAHYDRVGSNSDQGSAYVFTRSGTTWTQQRKLVASDGAASDRFGYSVAIAGDTAVVGAHFDNVGSNSDQGSAYMYYWGSLRATAGGASLSGRVLETNGRGLANATVVLTDSMGVERTVQTGSFGRFSFSDLPSGETYIVSVRSRRFVFAPQVVNLQSDLSDVRLEASGKAGR